MIKPALIVLAAGVGSRYGGLKQIDPIGPHGELIIDYSIYDALMAGFGQVVFVLSEEIEESFRRTVSHTIERHCQTTYVLQKLEDLPPGFTVPPGRDKPWGTAHAALSCRNIVHSPFAVINADDFYGRSAYQAIGAHLTGTRERKGVCDFAMIGYLLEDTLSEHGPVSRGICTTSEEGHLIEIRECRQVKRVGQVTRHLASGGDWKDLPRGAPVSMNMWGFTPSLFSELEARFPQFLEENAHQSLEAEFRLPEVMGDLVREARTVVQVLPAKERWFGVTYQQDKPHVGQAIRDLIGRGIYPENLWAAR